ncbi:DNA cytosine methyltransferase [Yersinia aleksiciae]|uniref:Methyltransferase n=1 Tax=Yersinia aleksiciae TaxID=263819 RepID=A0ABN4H0Z5_YERAE|nr:DNA cytosine methyltransferase [Yersinia aleksiciae]AKP32144.1 methyltransferase [Yersinia aleksiciae]CFQ34326.1 C-5 cytosine-specific DNA methylase [Yersinia aleksiciae]
MTKGVYYNEIDPYAAQWLRNLIKAGHIAPSYVDERSIVDVKPEDLTEFTQCHFFAGIGVWSYALRRAGWPDNQPVWTGSCPCQPFSAAGKGAGFDDERHLWPAFFHLISECKPTIVFGEQVASKAVDTWIDLVQADMEGVGYAFASTPFPSAGIGAPHIRDRNFWLADAKCQQHKTCIPRLGESHCEKSCGPSVESSGFCLPGRMVHRDDHRQQSGARPSGGSESPTALDNTRWGGKIGALGDTEKLPLGTHDGEYRSSGEQQRQVGGYGLSGNESIPGPTNGFWRDADWLLCRDGKWRPVEPGTFPLVNGLTSRVGRLRAYGNAINAEAAKAFISAYIATPLWVGFDHCGVSE